jgi:hypothetical protein
MSSQESQRPEHETEDNDALAVGPLLVTKLQGSSSVLDAFLVEVDASSYSIVLIPLLPSLGIWYQRAGLQKAHRRWLAHRRVDRVYAKKGVNIYQGHFRSESR